jgi:polyribonucleotide nucleotidyltransferase
MKEYKTNIGDKEIIVKMDDLASQTNGSVLVSMGGTTVMATAVMSKDNIEGLDYFPLMVFFEEKFYAVGKILGSRFMRREGRPSDNGTLNSRLVDRTIRPLFPAGLKREVQVVTSCLTFDEENDPDVIAVLAASLALGVSDIPWNGPVAPIRINNNGVLNPTYKEREDQDFEIFVTGVNGEKEPLCNMIESEAKQNQEKEIFNAFAIAFSNFKSIIDFQEMIIKENGKTKIEFVPDSFPEIDERLSQEFSDKLEATLMTKHAVEEKASMILLEKEIKEFAKEEFGDDKVGYCKDWIEKKLKNIFISNVLQKEQRPDGRKIDQVREISARVGVLPRVHGTGVFMRGYTKAMAVVTLGGPGDKKLVEGMEVSEKQRFMHHYNFPPYSVGEVRPLRGPGRREIGHGALAEKALISLLPSESEFPYTIRVVTEIMSSNGSTSMASVSAGSLALMDAGVPVKGLATGIAVGLASDENGYKLLTDIQGPEDHYGQMDFKVAGTKDGITAIQMDIKIDGITLKMVEESLDRAKIAREHILGIISQAISEPRKELSPFVPKIYQTMIDPAKIGMVIGSGGKTINELMEEFNVTIDVEDDGSIFVTSVDNDSGNRAIEKINAIVKDIEIGEIYEGKITKVLDFGAVVQLLPGKDGMVHISELADTHVKKVEDIVKLGDIIKVKVISKDRGRVGLSRKQAMPKEK